MQAFGVTFFRADIEKMIPADLKTLSPEAIYLELERLVAEMPDLFTGQLRRKGTCGWGCGGVDKNDWGHNGNREIQCRFRKPAWGHSRG